MRDRALSSQIVAPTTHLPAGRTELRIRKSPSCPPVRCSAWFGGKLTNQPRRPTIVAHHQARRSYDLSFCSSVRLTCRVVRHLSVYLSMVEAAPANGRN